MTNNKEEIMLQIKDVIDTQYELMKNLVSVQDIATKINKSKSTTFNYLQEMVKSNQLFYDPISKKYMTHKVYKAQTCSIPIPVVGEIACGTPVLAEENITDYIQVSSELLGKGDFFILKAKGNSMINAGIDNGDYVVVRQQNTAEEGEIVVALIDNDATLKRFFIDRINEKIILHPENDTMSDMIFDKVEIQGIVKKVLKDVH